MDEVVNGGTDGEVDVGRKRNRHRPPANVERDEVKGDESERPPDDDCTCQWGSGEKVGAEFAERREAELAGAAKLGVWRMSLVGKSDLVRDAIVRMNGEKLDQLPDECRRQG